MKSVRSQIPAELLAVLACCAVFFFYGLGSFGLVGADEPRYGQIAREMLQRHDWITPVLNGVAWLEKPVLYYWSAMLSYSLFGFHDWAARVPTAVMATLMVLGVYFFMRRFREGSQLDAAIILTTLAGVIGFARAASTDMPLTATLTLGLLCWFAWYQTRSKSMLLGFYFFLALATLAKGPVAPFLTALVIVAFAIARREWKILVGTLSFAGILVYLVVALPWFVLVQRANPQFVRVFILEHNLARYSSDVFRHHQPFWYYVPVLLAALLPWLAFAVPAFARAARRNAAEPFGLFFALWAILPVIFFSFSGSKLPGYILPSIPSFTILVADYLRQRKEESFLPSLGIAAVHSVLVGTLLGAALLTNYFVLRLKPSSTAIAIAVIAGIICAGGMLAAILMKSWRVLHLATLVPMVLAICFVIKFAGPTIDLKNSARPIAQEISSLASRGAKQVAVFGVPRDIEYGLNFYAHDYRLSSEENQAIASYDRGEFPSGEHLLVAKQGSAAALQKMLGKRVKLIGSFPTRKLEFYSLQAR
jgi:4-amino-4-deoxy-L-arabinose transferase-like glycosyltransferase